MEMTPEFSGALDRLNSEIRKAKEGKKTAEEQDSKVVVDFNMRHGDEKLRNALIQTIIQDCRDIVEFLELAPDKSYIEQKGKIRVNFHLPETDNSGVEVDGVKMLSEQEVQEILGRFKSIYEKGYSGANDPDFQLRPGERLAVDENGTPIETLIYEMAETLKDGAPVNFFQIKTPYNSKIPKIDGKNKEINIGTVRQRLNREFHVINSRKLVDALFLENEFELQEVKMAIGEDSISFPGIEEGDVCVIAQGESSWSIPFVAKKKSPTFDFDKTREENESKSETLNQERDKVNFLGADIAYKGFSGRNTIISLTPRKTKTGIVFRVYLHGPAEINDKGEFVRLNARKDGEQHAGGNDEAKSVKIFKVIPKKKAPKA